MCNTSRDKISYFFIRHCIWKYLSLSKILIIFEIPCLITDNFFYTIAEYIIFILTVVNMADEDNYATCAINPSHRVAKNRLSKHHIKCEKVFWLLIIIPYI